MVDIEREIARRKVAFLEKIKSYATSKIVFEAFKVVNHSDFVAPGSVYRGDPYSTGVIVSLEGGSTISRPDLTAMMMSQAGLTGNGRVLEVGTGSGYSAALLSRCSKEVFTIEQNEKLAQSASERLKRLGFTNVEVCTGDGALGLATKAPFDTIFVTAAARRIPKALREQLAEGGKMVIPVGKNNLDLYLIKVTKVNGRFIPEVIIRKGDGRSLNFSRLKGRSCSS